MSPSQPSNTKQAVSNEHLEKLVQEALALGASEAKAVLSEIIAVEEKLANFCVDPQCKAYGLAPSCPPYVSGPAGFRELQKELEHAIVVRVTVPTKKLLSQESREVGRSLYELVATVEKEAIQLGYSHSQAFAGGSCKQIFCNDYPDCSKLSESGICRFPEYARASMSGYGVDVFGLIKACGWPANVSTHGTKIDTGKMSWMAGLILVG